MSENQTLGSDLDKTSQNCLKYELFRNQTVIVLYCIVYLPLSDVHMDRVTVDVNPNIRILALFEIVWLLNGSDFERRLKSEQFCSDFGRLVG